MKEERLYEMAQIRENALWNELLKIEEEMKVKGI